MVAVAVIHLLEFVASIGTAEGTQEAVMHFVPCSGSYRAAGERT